MHLFRRDLPVQAPQVTQPLDALQQKGAFFLRQAFQGGVELLFSLQEGVAVVKGRQVQVRILCLQQPEKLPAQAAVDRDRRSGKCLCRKRPPLRQAHF